jgi:hypothetical protein
MDLERMLKRPLAESQTERKTAISDLVADDIDVEEAESVGPHREAELDE